MENQYIGISSKLLISDKMLKIKNGFMKGEFYLPHIEYIDMTPRHNYRNRLEINANGMNYFIDFFDEKKEVYKELYDFLLPYTERIQIHSSDKKLIIYNKLNCQKTGSLKRINKTPPITTISTNKIIDCEIIDNIHQPNTSLRDTASATIIGGGPAALAAIYASTFSNGLSIKLTIDDPDYPVIYIHYIAYPIKKNSNMMNAMISMCDRDYAKLHAICRKNNENTLDNQHTIKTNPIEEIKKLKELLDLDILTQEEFDKKKKELLNL